MTFLKREWLVMLLMAVVAAWSVKALAIPEFYTSHDGDMHAARLANFYLALREGQLPPQLAPTLFGGFGFPIFIFIYPLPYAMGSLFHFLGLSYTDSTETTLALAHILSAVFIYIFFKLELKKTWPAIIATLFFTLAPYRFLLTFVRGAFAESFAYIFIASSLVCLNRLSVYQNRRLIGLTALSIAGLLLSHQLVSVMFLPVLAWYVLYKLIFQPHKRRFAWQSLASVWLGFGMATFIYFPAYFEREALRFDELMSGLSDHYVTVWQLVRSPWGYGFSHPGVIDDAMSFQVGLTHLAAVAITLVFLSWNMFKRRGQIRHDSQIVALVFWLVAFGLSVLLMVSSPVSLWLWNHLPGLNYIDFPWRLLGVSVIASSFVVGYLLARTKTLGFLSLFFLFFVFYANRNHLRINQSIGYSDDYFENYPATATWRNEFLPYHRLTNNWEGIDQDWDVENGQSEVEIRYNTTTHLILAAESSQSSRLRIHRMYFPGWQVSLNGQRLSVEQDDALTITDASVDLATGTDYSGFLRVDLEPGSHLIEAKFETTPLRQIGRWLSLFSVILAGVLILTPMSQNKKSPDK